jgi:hypothetical protein
MDANSTSQGFRASLQEIHEMKQFDLEEIAKILTENSKIIWKAKYYKAWTDLILKQEVLRAMRRLPKKVKNREFLKAWLRLNFPELSKHETNLHIDQIVAKS